MAVCRCCGKTIDHVMVNFFGIDGCDSFIPCDFKEYENGAIELDVDKNWTGYELEDEERKETIECPECNKFPFDDEFQIYEIVRVVMFNEKKGEQQ